MELQRQRQCQSAGFPAPMVGRGDLITPNPKLKLLDQVREIMRLKHYSIRSETVYCDWIRRYIKFHGMRSREELPPTEAKMELFLSDLMAVSKAFDARLTLSRAFWARSIAAAAA